VEIALGAKGLIEVELVCSTQAWGRGAKDDIHSSYKAELDTPSGGWSSALDVGVGRRQRPAIDGWFEHVKPLTDRSEADIAQHVAETNEADVKSCWVCSAGVRDLSYEDALDRLASQPTSTSKECTPVIPAPAVKTVLPSKAVAKLDFRLVPDQTAAEAAEKLKAHLAKRGYGDIEVR